ncbi:MAG TPA: cyclase family protein [Coriobacteriia bacterium]|jgi:arylformamidase
MADLIDVSVPMREGMPVWPGDEPFRISRVSDMAAGDRNNLSELRLGTHTGTHVDAPAHFIADGATIDSLPLGALVGECRALELQAPEAISTEELQAHEIRPGERILLKTRNSSLWAAGAFHEDFTYLSTEAAEWLAEVGPGCLGVDYLSVGGFHRNGTAVHRALLGAGIWLIEGLDLSAVTPGSYELLCLPLRLVGAEGAPARALLRPLG